MASVIAFAILLSVLVALQTLVWPRVDALCARLPEGRVKRLLLARFGR